MINFPNRSDVSFTQNQSTHSLKNNNYPFTANLIVNQNFGSAGIRFIIKIASEAIQFIQKPFQSISQEDAKLRIKALGLEDLLLQVETFKTANKTDLIRRMANLGDHEIEFLQYIQNDKNARSHLEEIFSGAHVYIKDHGAAYQQLQNLKNGGKIASKKGISSHPSDGQQFRMRGHLIKELLYGKIKKDGHLYTTIQLENNPISFTGFFPHMADYAKYKITGKNVGPYGLSSHTHKNPIIIHYKFKTD